MCYRGLVNVRWSPIDSNVYHVAFCSGREKPGKPLVRLDLNTWIMHYFIECILSIR